VIKGKILALAGALLAFGMGSQAWAFELTSPDIPPDSTVPMKNVMKGFGCTGGNESPALAWKDPPADTKSFAVTVYDPDAPTGSGFWHWVVFNIPANVMAIPAGAGDTAAGHHLPKGAVQGDTDTGLSHWNGPCPPPGDKPHHYIFTVYALKLDKLPAMINTKSPGALVGFFLHMNAIDKASFTATFGR
jgi:hypothetical protein